MITVLIVNVIAKNKLRLLRDNNSLKEPDFKMNYKFFFEGTQSAWNKFLRPALTVAAPLNGMAIGAKTKNPEFAQATMIILHSISGGKILSLTDMHLNGLRLRVMYLYFK